MVNINDNVDDNNNTIIRYNNNRLKLTSFTELSDYITKLDCEKKTNTPAVKNYCKDHKNILLGIEKMYEEDTTPIYNIQNDVLLDTTHNLADKKTTVEIFKKETNNLKDHINNIKQERMNKQRLVEASEWEYDRYNSHIYIFKFIFFSLVIINIILFIRKRFSVVPDAIYFGFIILVAAIMIYNVVSEVMTNMQRDKFDYDKFKQTYDAKYNSNEDGFGKQPEGKSGGIFKSLMCESFTNGREDTLNGHHYSFIN